MRSCFWTTSKEGAQPVLAAHTLGEIEETAQLAKDLGATSIIVPTDVSDEAQVNDMVSQSSERFSNIDVLVNNAGR